MIGDKYYIWSLHWTVSGYAFAFVLLRRQENVWARSSSCYVLGGTGWVHVFLVRRGRKIRLVLGCYKKNPSFQRIERKIHLVLEGWPNLRPSFQRRERKIHLVLGHWSFLDLLVLCEQLVFLYLPRKNHHRMKHRPRNLIFYHVRRRNYPHHFSCRRLHHPKISIIISKTFS